MFHVVKNDAVLRDKDETNNRNDHSQDVILQLLSLQGPGMPGKYQALISKVIRGKRLSENIFNEQQTTESVLQNFILMFDVLFVK